MSGREASSQVCALPLSSYRGIALGGRTPRAAAPSNTVMASLLSDLLSDARLAVRGLRHNPLFATVAILSLALGIGANAAIFRLVDQILLRTLPVRAPHELVMLYQEGEHMRQQHGVADALVSPLPGPAEEGRAAVGGALPRLAAGVDRGGQPDRAGRGRDGLGQLLLDARREAGARPRVQLPGGRPGLPGAPGRRAQLRLLDEPVRARPEASSAGRSGSTTTR